VQALHSATDVWTSIYTYERMKQRFVACVHESVNPHNDFNILFGKLLLSMHSGVFSQASTEQLAELPKLDNCRSHHLCIQHVGTVSILQHFKYA
jgi:hypothetical protein